MLMILPIAAFASFLLVPWTSLSDEVAPVRRIAFLEVAFSDVLWYLAERFLPEEGE